MSEEYGPDFVTLTDEDGNEFELEHLGTLELNGTVYMSFVPADMDEDDEDFGLILLKVVEKDGEELLADIDNEEELNEIYEQFMEVLFEDEEEEQENLPPLYERLEESHVQRAYPVEEIISLLQEAGLEFVAVYGGCTKEAPKPDSDRVYFIARETYQEKKYYE